jgi:uncharacterized protein YcfJ
MKKFLIVILMFVVLGFAVPAASAQPRHRHHRHSRTYWQKHRDKLTVAGTTATGALVGSVIGGKKGALIGAGAGAGSGALYTYKIRKRHRHRRHYPVPSAR